MKRFISLILVLIMLVSLVAACGFSALAATYITYGDYKLAVNSNNSYLVASYSGNETALTFPDSAYGKAVVGVAEDFYDNCEAQLVSVTMPDSFEVIDNMAFYGMSQLEEVVLSGNISSIGYMAFSDCASLSDINLEQTSLQTVSFSCFSGCSSLNSVEFPSGLKCVSDYAFSRSGLTSATLPDGVTAIGSYAFSDCTTLEEVSFPYGLETIGEYAFYNDRAITSIFVPDSVTQIGAMVFNPMGLEDGTLTVDCFTDSYAAQYAYDNFINFNCVRLGDVDSNDAVDINDVTYIQLYRVDLYEIGGNLPDKRCDVDRNGEITLRDATVIQMKLAGMITEF